MRQDNAIRRFAVAILLASLTVSLAPVATISPSSTRQYAQAAPLDVLLVDHEGDASEQPCTSGADNDCSLRSAIEHANSGPGPDTITFESGDKRIALGSRLPALSDDSTTIAPLDSGQVIEIDANGINGNVFEITADDIRLSHLRIYGSGSGWANIWIHGSAQAVAIANNVIGDNSPAPGGCGNSDKSHTGIYVSLSGSASGARVWIYGNAIKCNGRFGAGEGHGIVLTASDHVVIGEDGSSPWSSDEANEIVANAGHGVLIWEGSSDNLVNHNVIVRNAGSGVVLEGGARHNLIGGDVDSGNQIEGNAGDGVLIQGTDVEQNLVQGNRVANNEGSGIVLAGGASHNLVGQDLDYGNQIAGNDGDGILILGTGTDGNRVQGNLIGTTATGDVPRPNGRNGVAVKAGASNNIIGSDVDFSQGNLISGNTLSGVRVVGDTTSDTTIDGNVIGANWARTAAVPNGDDGINISGAKRTIVGSPGAEIPQGIASNGGAGVFDKDTEGTYVGLSNHIAFNQGAGIAVVGSAHGSDLIPRTVQNNGGPAIDLGDDGPTSNDPGDSDTGPNALLNYPRITSSSGSTITGTACADCHVRIYEAAANPARSHGGGEFVTVVSSDGAGNWNASLSFGLTAADVTLVARDLSGNTSEMAPRWQTFLPLVMRYGCILCELRMAGARLPQGAAI